MTTTKRVGSNQSFGECVLTTEKRVGGLQIFGVCILTTVKRVGNLQSLGESVLAPQNVQEDCRALESAFSPLQSV